MGRWIVDVVTICSLALCSKAACPSTVAQLSSRLTMSLSQTSFPDAFTYEAWVKSPLPSRVRLEIFAGDGDGFYFMHNGCSNYAAGSGSTTAYALHVGWSDAWANTCLRRDTWAHVAVTRPSGSGHRLTFYINGMVAQENSGAVSPFTFETNPTFGGGFTGSGTGIFNARVWNVERSSSQIADYALTTSIDGMDTTTGLIGWWPLTSDLGALVGADLSGAMPSFPAVTEAELTETGMVCQAAPPTTTTQTTTTTTTQAWGCTTGSGTGCQTCVEQSSRTSDTTCATCNNGYYESTGSCQANQCSCLNGDAVADGIDCTNDGDNICVGCDAGYFLQSAECQACGSDCQTCSDSTTCTTCENDKFLHNGNCITSCPAGYASLGSNPGKFCQAYGCTIGPDEGCADCVSQELRINDASCSSCNDETYGYYVDVNDFTCNSICIDQVCTCPVGMHGSTTLVGDASFGGCHISPTSIDAWVIKLSDEDDAVVYDEISKKIIVMFEKSGGRTHQLSLFKVDCTTEVPDNDLLKLVSANGQLAGVNIDDLENEFLHMEIDVDLTKMESTSLRDTTAATGKVDFCVRADLKDGPGANSHGVNFIRARMTMEVNIVASIQEVAVKLESTDTDISMGPDDALTHVIELDACQCGIDALEPNDRCVESEAAHRDVSIDSPPKLTPSDRLILCISTQTDVVEIHEINNLKLTQPSDSGGDSTTFDVIEDSIVSGLASYDSLDKQTGHIHRVRTNLVNTFFKNTGSGTIDQTDVTVSGTAKVLFKPSRRLALANVVIKRSLQEQQEREGRFSMTIALQGNEDVEAPASTVALTGTTEALATAVAPTTTAEASIALTSSTTTTTLLWGYEVKSNMKCKNKGGEIELIIPDGTENLEHFCASKCNITGSCVGFVSKDKEAICGLRLRSMYAPTQKHGMSCYVRTGQASVQVTMRVENIEHSLLMANESLLSQFVERAQRVVAQNAGNGVSHEDVEVFLSPGSIVMEASVHAYSGLEPTALHQELTTSVNILDELVQSLQSIPGIASVSTGAIAVSNFQAAHRSATTPSDQTPKSKDSDKFDWVLFVLIPGATLMFVLCLLCCAIWALRVRKQHRREDDDRQPVSGNDEESQKQEPSKAMTPSPASATAQTPTLASTTLAETDAVIFVVDSNDQAQLSDVVSI